MAYFLRCLKFILPAAETTLLLTVAALGIGLMAGLLLAVARIYGGKAAAGLASAYSRIVRSLPTLVVLFIFYSLSSSLLHISGVTAALLALSACTAAYQSEIFRGAIQSLGTGQMAAARSLGMTRPMAIRYVILPQALRLAIPSWSNEAAIVLKDSSLASAVGATEIFRRAQQVGAAHHDYLPAYLACGLIYFVLTFLTNRGLDLMQRKFKLKL